ncbi:hypothetical protein STAFG_3917 [Streptomyces afghaniensis 772]|uniref:Uncharacterized protein n=1 Tax=Streptomyces afghaniensis 772 TaxID=1283301 RepID=S4MTS0_9ACTN|nr:hypothetical protein STAFG_3917 [Streptomyces afghaniensis 772]
MTGSSRPCALPSPAGWFTVLAFHGCRQGGEPRAKTAFHRWIRRSGRGRARARPAAGWYGLGGSRPPG